MKQILLLAVMVSVALTSYAYAETSTVEVPFESHGQSCWFDELAVEYHCTWQGIVDPITLEELEEFKGLIADDIYQQAIDDINAETLKEIEEQKIIEQAKLTPNEQLIERLQAKYDRGVADTKDIVLLKMLKDLDTCQQGVGRSEPIQHEREFEISLAEDWKWNNVDYKNKLGKLAKAIEECRAQQHMETYTLSAQYDHFVNDKDDIWYDHRAQFEGVQALPYDKFTETSREIDMDAICNNNQYSIEHRLQFDCYVAGYPTNEQIEAENKLSGNYNYSGGIVYGQEIFEEYYSFLEETGGKIATIEDKQREADKASIIVEELLSENAWYNRD